MTLTRRESEVVRLLGGHRYLSRAQIEQFVLAGVSPNSLNTTSWRILSSLAERKLVQQSRRGVGGAGGGSTQLGYFLTTRGYKLARTLDQNLPSRRLPSGGTFLMRHALMTADVALAFRQAAAANAGHALLLWESDWQAAQPLGPSTVVPDAHLVYATADYELEALLEVDLGTEGSRFFRQKIERYLELYRSGQWRNRFPVWPVILTVTESENRAEALRRSIDLLLRAQPNDELLRTQTEFALTNLPRLTAAGPLAEIWRVVGRSGEQALLPPVVARQQIVDSGKHED